MFVVSSRNLAFVGGLIVALSQSSGLRAGKDKPAKCNIPLMEVGAKTSSQPKSVSSIHEPAKEVSSAEALVRDFLKLASSDGGPGGAVVDLNKRLDSFHQRYHAGSPGRDSRVLESVLVAPKRVIDDYAKYNTDLAAAMAGVEQAQKQAIALRALAPSTMSRGPVGRVLQALRILPDKFKDLVQRQTTMEGYLNDLTASLESMQKENITNQGILSAAIEAQGREIVFQGKRVAQLEELSRAFEASIAQMSEGDPSRAIVTDHVLPFLSTVRSDTQTLIAVLQQSQFNYLNLLTFGRQLQSESVRTMGVAIPAARTMVAGIIIGRQMQGQADLISATRQLANAAVQGAADATHSVSQKVSELAGTTIVDLSALEAAQKTLEDAKATFNSAMRDRIHKFNELEPRLREISETAINALAHHDASRRVEEFVNTVGELPRAKSGSRGR